MMDRYKLPRKRRIQDSRRLFGFAVSLDPSNLFVEMGSPLPSRLSDRAGPFVIKKAEESNGDFYRNEVEELLNSGIRDTVDILHPKLEKIISEKGIEAALKFAADKRTAAALASLALRPESLMKSLIQTEAFNPHGVSFRLTEDGPAMIASERLIGTQNEVGCPLAGENAEVKVDPLFKKFTDWTGQLCIASIANNHRRNKQKNA